MNPDDVTAEYAAVLSQVGINRVSMGAQTFDDERLRFLHRRHTASQVRQAVDILRKAGIRNISIDLMYGFPDETLDDWQRDIDAALALDVEHISAYCLMIEENTPLWKWIDENGKWRMDEELERQMYEMLIDKLTVAGFEHYEISNFAKPGYRSRHNSSYWQDTPYVGIGAAAHSYNPPLTPPEGMGIRSWNVADLDEYMAGMERGERLMEQELIDGDTHYNDRITVALRTRDGLNLSLLTERQRSYCLKEAQRFLDDGLLQLHGGHLSLTRNGLFVSDYIMSELIMV
jgi:oxygen-independent coproporphyrinogen-3 oxidase